MGAPNNALVGDAGISQQQQQLAALQQQNQALQQQVSLQQQLANSQPQAPDITSLIDPTTGMIQSNYQMNWGNDVTPNMDGMDAYRQMALGTGPSAWAQAALGQQALEEQQQRQNAQQLAGSSAAQARSAMASKYGLSPAAQERLAKTQMRSQMAGLQNVGLSGAQARANIGLQDAATRNQFLQGLPGQENALAQIQLQNKQGALGVDQANIANSIAAKNTADQNALNKYHEQMSAWAANQNSQAMRQSGGGGK